MGVAACVAAAILLTQLLFLFPSVMNWRENHREAAIERVREAWYHSIPPGTIHSPERKLQIGRRMISDGLIEGGIIYDAVGDPMAVFGELPLLDLNLSRISGVDSQPTPDADAFDVHLSPKETGLGGDIILRLSQEPVDAATLAQAIRVSLSMLGVAGVAALLIMLFMVRLVVRPLRQINSALQDAIADPTHASAHQLKFTRHDEIGEIGGAVDQLLSSVAAVYQDELAVLRAANDAFDFALIRFGSDGRPAGANAAALRLFSVDDVEELAKANPNCASLIGAKKTQPRPLLDVLSGGRVPALVGLHVYAGMVTALGYTVAVHSEADGKTVRFVALVIIDDLMRDARKALLEAKKADLRTQKVSVELRETRRLLESCLCLLETNGASSDEQVQAVAPDRILHTWYGEAVRDGLVSGKLEHGSLPRLNGRPSALRNALRQGLFLLYAHSRGERPSIRVEASEGADRTVTIVMKDISAERLADIEPRKRSVDPTLPHAALVQALAQAGGSFGSLDLGSAGAATITFVLPSDAASPSSGGATENQSEKAA